MIEKMPLLTAKLPCCVLSATGVQTLRGAPETLEYDASNRTLLATESTKTVLFLQPDVLSSLSIKVAAKATLSLFVLLEDALEANLDIHCAEGSTVTVFPIALSPEAIRFKLAVALAGESAHCELQGMVFASKKQQLTAQIDIQHQHPNTTSNLQLKSIVMDQSKVSVLAKVTVAERAIGVLSDMQLPALLLSNQAMVEAQPELEIYADDVKCSHGAAVGDLDESALFYLQARGIEAQMAKRLLLKAFLNAVVSEVPSELQPCLYDAIETKNAYLETVDVL